MLPTFVLLPVFCPFVSAFVNGSWAVKGSYNDVSSFVLEVFTKAGSRNTIDHSFSSVLILGTTFLHVSMIISVVT
jgi:hypothetical protein